jgi:hypothetical protein
MLLRKQVAWILMLVVLCFAVLAPLTLANSNPAEAIPPCGTYPDDDCSCLVGGNS